MVPDEKTDAPTPNGLAAASAKLHEWGVTGSLRGAYWSSNRRVDDEDHLLNTSLWLKLDRKIIKNWGVFIEGYLNSEDPFGDHKNTNRVREAYVEGRLADWDFRLGKQIIAWGRADRFNPTDNLTPRDFTLLAPEIDEDRFGSVAAKAAWNWNSSTSLTAVWVPIFRPHVFAFPEQAGVSFSHDIPDSRRQWALKLDQSGKAVDWSVSYYTGLDLMPDISFGGLAPGGIVAQISHHRVRVIGGDAATSFGAYRFAVELAHTRTEDADGNNPSIKNPYWFGVLGVERTFVDNLSLNTQFFVRRVDHYADPESIADPTVRALAVQNAILNNQYDKQQYGLTMRIGKKWLNETLEGELAGSLLLNRSGYLVRPKLIYAANDRLKLIAGVEYFSGSDKTSYGRQEKNRGVFAEARYFF
ncbi:MAG: DUF1302 family protein [Burkholderiales bacterium]